MPSVAFDPTNALHVVRFLRRFRPLSKDECWPWLGSCLSGSGRYGAFYAGGKTTYAHRAAWTLFRGEIPVGLTIDHLCKNPRCVNPHHLEVVTLAQNVARSDNVTALNARKTKCIRGHALSGDNLRLYTRPAGALERRCKTCRRLYLMGYRAQARQAVAAKHPNSLGSGK